MNKRQAKKQEKKEELQQILRRKQDEEYIKSFESALNTMRLRQIAPAAINPSGKIPTIQDLAELCETKGDDKLANALREAFAKLSENRESMETNIGKIKY